MFVLYNTWLKLSISEIVLHKWDSGLWNMCTCLVLLYWFVYLVPLCTWY